jgi:RNA polymerase sigma-70 factor (ECF subfamily)
MASWKRASRDQAKRGARYNGNMNDPPARGPHEFATTHWSLVIAAQSDEASQSRARDALETLCQAYWYPLYAFVRYRGYSAHDAQDLTQAFFAQLIETAGIATADPARGRFRSYLLGAMKHFLANQWHRAQSQKRGGGVTFVQLDALDAQARYAVEPAQTADPDAGFDRQWAEASIARAMAALRAESAARGKSEQFAALRTSLVGQGPERKQLAAQLGMTEGAVKVAVHRLRRRFRELLRAQIAETVSDPSEIDDEMRYLLAALRGTTN